MELLKIGVNQSNQCQRKPIRLLRQLILAQQNWLKRVITQSFLMIASTEFKESRILIMDTTYNIDTFYQKWIRLGWMATGNPWPEEVDPELLIVQTTHAARTDSRLFKWLLTWIRDNNDLINIKRFLRIITEADTAVLGAVIEIAIKETGNHNLNTILNKCSMNKIPELLFTG